MAREVFSKRSFMPVSAQQLMDWHKQPGAFARLAPPWVQMELLERHGGIENGATVTLKLVRGPASVKWKLEHGDYVEGEQFCDRQLEGPFAYWLHTHRFEPDGTDKSVLCDTITYEVPAGIAGELAGGIIVHVELERLFKFRHRLMQHDMESLQENADAQRKTIAVTGSTGLIGSALCPYLATQGQVVLRMVRPGSRSSTGLDTTGRALTWDPASGAVDLSMLEGIDALVHLSGDNIADGRWTEEKRRQMVASRVGTTKLLVDAMRKMKQPPRVFLAASAIGYYGDGQAARLDESGQAGRGFLADLCLRWEAEAMKAAEFGVRVVNMRIGCVLSPRGGALAKMLLPFQMGAGGHMGSGQQYFSWISVDDVAKAILYIVRNQSLFGPVNVVAPNAVTNATFTGTFGRILSRPTIMPMPAFAARAAFGDLADECLLASQRVEPKRLLDSGFQFRDPDIETALRHVLGRL